MYRAADECGAADLALVLSVTAVVVIKIHMRSAADRANFIFRNRLAVAAADRLKDLLVSVFVVGNEELPVLFVEWDDDWKLIDLELLVFGRYGIIVYPLLKRDEFADKIQQE